MEEELKSILTACIAANIPQIAEAVVEKLNQQPRPIHTIERKEAAKALGLSLPTLDGLIRKGDIRAKKIGRRVVIPEGEIENILASGQPIKYRRG